MVADDAAEADDVGTMGSELVHMWHDWAGVAAPPGAGHEGVERALMWGMMMADSEKGWERRAGRKSQQNLVGLKI